MRTDGDTPERGGDGRIKTFLWRSGAIAAGLFLFFQIAVAVCVSRIERVQRTPFLGNSQDNIRRARKRCDPRHFTFFVVGDIRHGIATFERLLDIVSDTNPAFVVIVGDFVPKPEIMRHRLFIAEVSERTRQVPVFLIPGNHDISADREFHLADFQETYGPAQFSFTIGKHLFLFLNTVDTDDPEGYLRFMEKVLSEKADRAEAIYVFTHIPIPGLSPEQAGAVPYNWPRFVELVKTYKVRYVFAGDHHGYVKTERDGTTYIISGGGGARLYGRQGAFYHSVRVAVTDGKPDDSLIMISKVRGPMERVEENLYVGVWGTIARGWLSLAVTGLVVVGTLVLFVVSIRHWRRPRARQSQPQGGP